MHDWEKINFEDELDLDIYTKKEINKFLKDYKKFNNLDKIYYVYVLWKMYEDPRVPFYVGEGTDARVIKHGMKSEKGTNKYKDRIIEKHERLGIEFGYSIYDFYDTRHEALMAEIDLI